MGDWGASTQYSSNPLGTRLWGTKFRFAHALHEHSLTTKSWFGVINSWKARNTTQNTLNTLKYNENYKYHAAYYVVFHTHAHWSWSLNLIEVCL